MNTKNIQNYKTYGNNQIKIKRKISSQSCNLERIFKSKQNVTETPEGNTDAESFIIYINELEDIKAINLEEENDINNNIFKKLKKCSNNKKNTISSQCWHLLYKNLISDNKQNIINILKNNPNIPEIKEYIITNIQSDTHVFLKLNKIYNYNKKYNDDIFKY